ncbi:quinolinate synthase NadA [Candidatus Pacearchaeota archaeon]|nr:quinolinate synthase NadA [Candidatus Pacearchaeota archaeon]
MNFSLNQINKEAERLFDNLRKVGWSEPDCELIAPLTMEINQLKKEKDVIILAHSYITPDIIYGVADFIGDSYGLSKKVIEAKEKTILFCSVHFMAETAKIMNPKKTVLIPSAASCSLAESITPEDVRKLRKKYPEAGVICYVNTSAAVKAECDACCTSGNALKIVEGMSQKEILFLPDELMAKNLQPLTKKKIIKWTGRCIVHEEFSPKTVDSVRRDYPEAKILAHLECMPSVVEKVDMTGSTEGMIQYLKKSPAKQFMLATECGLSDRMKVEYPEKQIIGSCALCPYMKQIMLKDVLQALKEPRKDQIIELPKEVVKKAQKTLNRMVKIAEKQIFKK